MCLTRSQSTYSSPQTSATFTPPRMVNPCPFDKLRYVSDCDSRGNYLIITFSGHASLSIEASRIRSNANATKPPSEACSTPIERHRPTDWHDFSSTTLYHPIYCVEGRFMLQSGAPSIPIPKTKRLLSSQSAERKRRSGWALIFSRLKGSSPI